MTETVIETQAYSKAVKDLSLLIKKKEATEGHLNKLKVTIGKGVKEVRHLIRTPHVKIHDGDEFSLIAGDTPIDDAFIDETMELTMEFYYKKIAYLNGKIKEQAAIVAAAG